MEVRMKSIHERALEKASCFKRAEADLLEIIDEIDKAKSYFEKEFTSCFDYCVKFLKLSEAVSYNFISIARKSRQVPELVTAIKEEKISVSSAKKIAAVITPENKVHWLELAQTMPKAQLEKEVARANPQAAVQERVRYVAEDRLRLELAVSEKTINALKRAQEILSQRMGKHISMEEAIGVALGEFVERRDPVKKAARAGQRSEVRSAKGIQLVPGPVAKKDVGEGQYETQVNIPFERTRLRASQVHQINLRDRGQCTYIDNTGNRCEQKKWLQVHHVVSVRAGGQNGLGHLKTLCSAHHRMIHGRGRVSAH
jgi:hypothetical protein